MWTGFHELNCMIEGTNATTDERKEQGTNKNGMEESEVVEAEENAFLERIMVMVTMRTDHCLTDCAPARERPAPFSLPLISEPS